MSITTLSTLQSTESLAAHLFKLASESLDDHAKAEPLLRDAIRVLQDLPGKPHENMWMPMQSLAILLLTYPCNPSKNAEAKYVGKKAVSLAEQSLGMAHPRVRLMRSMWGVTQKANEKCHCGSGKKFKKCCKKWF